MTSGLTTGQAFTITAYSAGSGYKFQFGNGSNAPQPGDSLALNTAVPQQMPALQIQRDTLSSGATLTWGNVYSSGNNPMFQYQGFVVGPYTAPASGTVTDIDVWTTAAGSQITVALCNYSATAVGNVGSTVAQSAATSTTAAGFTTCNLTALTVVSGKQYMLCLIFNDGNEAIGFAASGSHGIVHQLRQSWPVSAAALGGDSELQLFSDSGESEHCGLCHGPGERGFRSQEHHAPRQFCARSLVRSPSAVAALAH